MTRDYLNIIDEKAVMLTDVADYIWEHPELSFEEHASAKKLCEALEAEGFKVEREIGGVPAAFSGTFGKGGPVIGILGEYDALDGLGQAAGMTEKKAYGGTCGHGCGHNLLGVGALGAAMAVKKYLETTGKSGTVIYFGCPAEEGASGKAHMALEGLFDGLDAAVTWHPGVKNRVSTNRSLANVQAVYKFDGVSSHAGGAPHNGRSALDAVDLMNVGVQFLREHVVQEVRMHHAITDTGGISPNVVQAHAEVLYLLRAPENRIVKDVYSRVNKIAEGAAMMTDTKLTIDFITGCSSTMPNTAMQLSLQKLMEEMPAPEPTAEELSLARELTEKSLSQFDGSDKESPLSTKLEPYDASEPMMYGSTDVGDVSWVCPTAQIGTATWPKGTPGHSWQIVSMGKSSWAHKMTRYAAKIMAAEVVELMEDKALLDEATAEFKRRTASGYDPLLPKGMPHKYLEFFRK